MSRSFIQLNESEKQSHFYLPRPKLLGWRSWSLLLPSLFSAVGFGAFAVLAYAFTEIQTLPVDFRRILVIIGSFSLAIGAELGTLPAIVEIFRKVGAKGLQHVKMWDWAGLAISLVATLVSFLFAFATLLGETTNWSRSFQIWGSIVMGLFAALDSYVNFAEFGLYLSTFDDRMNEWETQYAAWRKDMAEASGWAKMSRSEPEPSVQVRAVQAPVVQPRQYAVPQPPPVPSQIISTAPDEQVAREAIDKVLVRHLRDQDYTVPQIASETSLSVPDILSIIKEDESV